MSQLTKTGDAVEIRRSGFPVDIDTDPPDLEPLSCEPWELPADIDRPLFREPTLWERVRQFFSHAWHG